METRCMNFIETLMKKRKSSKQKRAFWLFLFTGCLIMAFGPGGTGAAHAQSTVPQSTVPGSDAAAVLYLPIALNASEAPVLPPNPQPGVPGSNACPEGQFLDLSNPSGAICRMLDVPEYGFNMDRFVDEIDTSTVIAAECSEESLEAALEQAAGGGTVQLPACTLDAGRVNIPSGVIIQGAGIDQTVITGGGCGPDGSPKRIFFANEVSNVVVRDITFDAQHENCSMLSVERSDNVLIERVAVRNGPTSAITFRLGVRNLTVRYSEMANHAEYHGLNSKDCSTGSTVADCPEPDWSRNYAVYSNVTYGNSLHGMNIHALEGEIAGNLSYGNGYGGKLFDGQCLWVHHNQFSGNDGWGMFIAPTLNIAERVPHDLYFYRNQFVETASDSWSWGITPFGQGFEHPVEAHTDVYVMDNVMDGRLKTDGVPLNICPGTFEDGLDVSPSQPGDAAVCSLPAYPSMGGSTLPFSACGIGEE